MIIDIARDFSATPGGRYRAESKFSGEAFRDDVLLPAMRKTEQHIIVDLDGLVGATTGFLEECFGNLVDRFGLAEIDRRMTLRAEQRPNRKELARSLMERAEKRRTER